ncbi:hypothetical protein [Streptomyces sp. NPDC090083]|uniref:hypothetical protein n=1 Tax=Streptomyces sp. NPDC090083 TaxID=3365941 RepID=UPI003807583F
MATSQSAGRPFAVHERTGRTTHDRGAATGTAGSVGSAGPGTTGHGFTDRAGAGGLPGRTASGGPAHRSGAGPLALVA